MQFPSPMTAPAVMPLSQKEVVVMTKYILKILFLIIVFLITFAIKAE